MLVKAIRQASQIHTVAKRFSSGYYFPKNTAVADEAYKAKYPDYFASLKPGLEQYTSPGDNLEKFMYQPGEGCNRTTSYLTMASTKAVYVGLARATATKFIAHMNASADVLALASVEVDLTALGEGTCATIKWRGKPVFVKNRTASEIAAARADDNVDMRDKETDAERVQQEKWLVVVGVCTHLGCVPIPNAGDFVGGFFCPCHGSHYDGSGRIRLGPAPLNLEVPAYRFEGDNTLIIG